jgi:hypothetical protein
VTFRIALAGGRFGARDIDRDAQQELSALLS